VAPDVNGTVPRSRVYSPDKWVDHFPFAKWVAAMPEPQASRRPPAAEFDAVPIDRVDVFQTILQRVQDWIEAARLQPGDRLPPERELADKLNVSRTSVRQALKVLGSLNRVEQRHGSGTYLSSPVRDPVASILLGELSADEDLIREVSDVRAAIDTLALELAEEHAGPAEFQGLADFLAEREHDLEYEPASPGSLDLRFEAAIAEISGNAVVLRLQAIVHELFLHAWAGRGLAPADARRLHREHLLILDAMQDGDWRSARDLMHDHVTRRAPLPAEEPE
jgi:GntR family transcriptional repressor for pyruvate dehydrogenase complex